MTSITLDLAEAQHTALQARAQALGLTIEDLVRLSIQALINRPPDELQRTIDYVTRKNAELYRRLA